MSAAFQDVMRDISATLRRAYSLGEDAGGVAVVPGGGTYAMEAVARQLAGGKKALVIRNGWRSEEHTSELQSLMRISYAVFCLKKKNKQKKRKDDSTQKDKHEITE